LSEEENPASNTTAKEEEGLRPEDEQFEVDESHGVENTARREEGSQPEEDDNDDQRSEDNKASDWVRKLKAITAFILALAAVWESITMTHLRLSRRNRAHPAVFRAPPQRHSTIG
jgi:hypothetical protein